MKTLLEKLHINSNTKPIKYENEYSSFDIEDDSNTTEHYKINGYQVSDHAETYEAALQLIDNSKPGDKFIFVRQMHGDHFSVCSGWFIKSSNSKYILEGDPNDYRTEGLCAAKEHLEKHFDSDIKRFLCKIDDNEFYK